VSEDKDQKTEQATPKREEDLRKEGKVVKSADASSAVVLAAVGGMIAITGVDAALGMGRLAHRALRLADRDHPLALLAASVPVVSRALLPLMGAAVIGAIVVGVAQTRGLFSMALAAPKPERLDPTTNIKNVLPSTDTAIELGKSLLKLTAIGFVVWQVVSDAMPRFALLATVSPIVGAKEIAIVAGKLALRAVIAFVAVAAIDWYFAWKKFDSESKMSKHDVREESKQDDGDPQIKRRIRQRMREAAKRRSAPGLAQATVLVVNPTHFAVALKYVPGEDAAPTLVAKALDDKALAMRTEARKLRIPIVENRPLARALHATGTVGKPIPLDLYRSVAAVIAEVLRIGGGPLPEGVS
jgi:flagellar biosynthesis protein FlhB